MGSRVLVVDDQADLRLLVGMYLGVDGHVVVGEASDLAEALRLAAELQPEVVILDQELPDGLGTDALARVREAAPGARVLVFSADPAVRALAAGAGADGFVQKGAPLDELSALLQH